jgi:hypothetical protein
MPENGWNVSNMPDDAVARALLTAVIQLICRDNLPNKSRLTLILGSLQDRATHDEDRAAFVRAVDWLNKLVTNAPL